uniref:Uncharacterized protein n=1 Tax=Chromera velia CCMP2878 TaxID=1169474 RepID=A0A0G4HWF9_9ALVE|eukprot:Cvel_9041.t1-p1 / transcript=Cvel_9041.t1 / gene=Cvel_9041 / organism=Chromera_velia_CCMP2878 / gene_product=hypothetical protein / transcript_product=hypothetical protein / location=Cvel_scaffold512:49147-49620(-) / protein_length=158 / sequence_SO=supercontig / SO=protein_coding / is_pseudo=false
MEIMLSLMEVSVPERITILYLWEPPGGVQVGRGLNDLRGVNYNNGIIEHLCCREGPDSGTCSYRRCYRVNEFDSYIFQHGWQNVSGRYGARRKGDDLSEHPKGYIPRCCYPMTIFLIGGWAAEETEAEYWRVGPTVSHRAGDGRNGLVENAYAQQIGL